MPPHLWGWRVRTRHNGEIPHQLLRRVRREPVVTAIHEPNGNRRVDSSLDRYEGARVMTRMRSLSGGLIANGSRL